MASTPMIGNYQLPSLDFLQLPDLTQKPTESKEELLANARLMQQTLAQFDIPWNSATSPKGPTITRYELHPAPGVKLEKSLRSQTTLPPHSKPNVSTSSRRCWAKLRWR